MREDRETTDAATTGRGDAGRASGHANASAGTPAAAPQPSAQASVRGSGNGNAREARVGAETAAESRSRALIDHADGFVGGDEEQGNGVGRGHTETGGGTEADGQAGARDTTEGRRLHLASN